MDILDRFSHANFGCFDLRALQVAPKWSCCFLASDTKIINPNDQTTSANEFLPRARLPRHHHHDERWAMQPDMMQLQTLHMKVQKSLNSNTNGPILSRKFIWFSEVMSQNKCLPWSASQVGLPFPPRHAHLEMKGNKGKAPVARKPSTCFCLRSFAACTSPPGETIHLWQTRSKPGAPDKWVELPN